MTERLSIGRVAALAGVGVETVRYYQRQGLLEQPAKSVDGQRRYTPDQVKRLRFIKRAQSLGFTLAEVSSLLALADGRCCADVRSLAAHKAQLIEAKLTALAAMHRALNELIRQCDANTGDVNCPIIELLIQD
ncbi:MerR family transcriptional regulator [Pseudomonas sp. TCU-HL1]|uniref:MerR family transcriptional regulator n=1 Tax=Pseudomonas sp. TCU-HL1 TaxID=1856685 RepID=UPI00083E0F0F|nr:MerR family transcriptional regulator [Pseudomonas sp. TCU-HL1]AOE85175.1 MerR family transcriptional regulator [Pseudomonas sp. TCU-HL1]